MKVTWSCLLYFFCAGLLHIQADEIPEKQSRQAFTELMNAEWNEVFRDPCTENWAKNWTLDGQKATVVNSKNGMTFTAGPKAFDNAHHAVLWTRQDFKGDVKIEYEFTRMDKEIRMVNILYIQATGSGKPGFNTDISTWADKRLEPAMSLYFNNMNTYHISYAAFGTKNTIAGNDYIRGRRYVCNGLKGTELDNEYLNTGLFEPGIPHTITVIKKDLEIFMLIKNDKKELLCHFVNSKSAPITAGKIGLRHMYTRGARYKNFTVSVRAEDTREAAECHIADSAALNAALEKAKPGDILHLPAGILKNWTAVVRNSGTEDAPIVIQGHGGDKTVFTGSSSIALEGCSYVQLKDIAFRNTSRQAVLFNNARHCTLQNGRFNKVKAGEVVLIKGNSRSNQVAYCSFADNPSVNIRIRVDAKTVPVDNHLSHNTFQDIPPINGNGRETIQIGQSQTLYGHKKVRTLVENNRFIRCNGEAEIISNKSSANVYRNNLFLDCRGEMVMRGGAGCTIENNRFENCSGGIRISGKNHIVRNNVISKSRNVGIRLLYGVADKAPAFYQAVSGCTIENNTIADAGAAGIFIGANRGLNLLHSPKQKKKLESNPERYGKYFDMVLAPHNNSIRFNVVFSNEGDLIIADQAPDNIISNNLTYSPNKDAGTVPDNNYNRDFAFTDIAAGDLTLQAADKETAEWGARGTVCKPINIKQ